jgi:hypothetical protein
MKPIEPRVRAQANAIASTLDDFLNGEKQPGKARERKYGFGVLIFEFGKIERGRMNWISNAERADMIVALKEMVAQLEGRVQAKGEA